ncbi:MAG: ATP-binding protein [Oceanipulchritudo sp.]
MSILIAALLVLCAYLALRLRRTRVLVAELLEASRRGKPVLLDRNDAVTRAHQLDKLIRAFNQLISDKATISSTGQEYFEQIQTTLGNLREAVVMADQVNTIRLANPAFSELTVETGDVLGRRLDLFIEGDAFHEFLQEIHTSGEGRRQELEVRINGRTRWIEVSAAPLQDKQRSDDSYTLFVFHDITRQKGLEKMRTEFIANLSHELRTPVTVIKGFAETLIEDEDVLTGEEKTRFLKKIRDNAERLHNLLQDLLLLSRMESTETVLQLEPVRLSEFLADLAESWESQLDSGQKLELDFAPGDDTVMADPLRLTQVGTNLFQNALGHARGFSTIRLSTRLEKAGVRLIFEDDGSGIPEKDLPHVFQRFYRVDKSRSRESGGTGLGLSIVKHIVSQHKGEIRARSEQGRGTTIEILLPFPPGRENADFTPRRREEATPPR